MAIRESLRAPYENSPILSTYLNHKLILSVGKSYVWAGTPNAYLLALPFTGVPTESYMNIGSYVRIEKEVPWDRQG